MRFTAFKKITTFVLKLNKPLELDDYYRQIEILLLSSTASTFAIATALITVLLLLFCSAMISGSEVAYFSLNNSLLKHLERSSSADDKRIVKLMEKPGLLLATILIANNFINIAIIIISSFLLGQAIHVDSISPTAQFFIEVVLVTFILVLFGEVSPKLYANLNKLKLAQWMSRPMLFLLNALNPLSRLLVSSTSYIEKRLAKKDKVEKDVSMEELGTVIDMTMSNENGEESNKQERKILKGIIQFGNVTAKQIMTARVNVTAIKDDEPFEVVLKMAAESNYSRIPIYGKSLDDIKGIIYVKDLLQFIHDKDFRWQDKIRPAYFVPETQLISTLLEKFKKDRVHIAIVVDEYGGTAGIVTMEDILEEIIGDIQDEFDNQHDEVNYEKLDNGHYLFDGRTLIIDVCRILEINTSTFDDVRGDSDSLAGIILEEKNEFPEANELFTIEGYHLKVISTNKRRIEKVEIWEEEEIKEEDRF